MITAEDFVANAVSLRQLDNAMHLGRLGEQIVLKSREAFDRIQFIDSIPAQKEEYSARKTLRDKEARRDYRRSKEQSADVNDIYMLDIMREGIRNGDQRLR